MSGLRMNPAFMSEAPAPIQPAAPTVRPMPSNDPNQVFFHFDLLRSLQLHRMMAVSIFATALLLGIAYMVHGWNRYTAETLVYVQPAPPHLIENGPTQRWPYDANTYESYIQQQIHNVTRLDVLQGAVKKLGDWKRPGESEQAAAERLGRSIEVARVGEGYQLSITAKAKNAAEAAQLANGVAQSFIEGSTRELRAGDAQRIELLREERERILKELSSNRAEQDDLNKKLGVASSTGPGPDPIDEQISQVRSELVKARTANDEAAARLTALSHGATSAALDAEAEQLVASDAGMVSMKSALNTRRSLLISQMANLTPNHPQYKQDEAELAQINASLESMSKNLREKAGAQIRQRLKNDLERTSTVEGKLNAELGQLTMNAGRAAPRLQRSNELAADILRLQNRFGIVDDQFRNLTMENNAPGAVYLSSAAPVPLHATHTKVIRNGMIVFVLGLVFALCAPLVTHNVDPRIYIAADVERVLGFAPMAQLPDFQQVSPGVAEEYLLRLAAAVEHAYQDGALKSCIFTGVASGAGATTVATRVSSMLEAMGRETVLVDASGSPQGASQAESAAGTELVPVARGSRSTALLQQMAQETSGNSIVVSDASPLLVSGETEYLARFVDSAIIVIESGVTTRDQLREVAHTLQRLQVSAVGFVLNRIPLQRANPSFVQSVRAVEKHLLAQSSARKPAAGNAQPKAQSAPLRDAAVNEHQDKPSPKPAAEPAITEARAVAAPSANQFPEPAAPPVSGATSVQNGIPTASPASVIPPEPVRVNIPYAPLTEDQPLADALSAVVLSPQPPVDVPVAATPSPVDAESGHVTRGRALKREAAPETPAPAQHHAASSPRPEPAVVPSGGSPARSTSKSAPEPPVEVVAQAPRVAWADGAAKEPSAAVESHREAPPVSMPLREEELPYSAASRLGGLRSLLVSLGLKSLNSDAEYVAVDTAPNAIADRGAERPVFAEPFLSASAAAKCHGAAEVSVVAQPEFLPPRPMVETTERENESPRPPANPKRASRWDAPDDVETLPSWRGQYRKRR